MIIGRIEIHAGALSTHRDTYALSELTVVSVRKPLLAPCAMAALALAAPGIAFADLVEPHEAAILIAVTAGLVGFGWRAACLKLLSRDLRGSELGEVLWGDVGRLNEERRRIAEAIRQQRVQRRDSIA